MLSRVADAIYWTSRYMERAESVARFVDVSLSLSLDMPSDAPEPWAALVETTGDEEQFRSVYGGPTKDNVLQFLTFDRTYPSSVLSCLRGARENARSVREVISSEMWEQINKAYLFVAEASRDPSALDLPDEFFGAVKQASHLFAGATDMTMAHNEGWHFGRLGRLLERADKTSRILDVKYFLPVAGDAATTSLEELHWAALLKSASALEMYRKRHGLVAHENVVDFLLLDRFFPRSVRFCVTKAERSLRAITGSTLEAGDTRPERVLGRLRASLEFATVEDVLAGDLHAYIDGLQRGLNAVGEAVFDTFVCVEPAPSEDVLVAAPVAAQ